MLQLRRTLQRAGSKTRWKIYLCNFLTVECGNIMELNGFAFDLSVFVDHNAFVFARAQCQMHERNVLRRVENPHVESVSITRCHIVSLACACGGGVKMASNSVVKQWNEFWLSHGCCQPPSLVIVGSHSKPLIWGFHWTYNCMCSVSPKQSTNCNHKMLHAVIRNGS